MERYTGATTLPVKVYCLPEERAQLRPTDSAARKSLTAYLLNVGLGYPVRGDQRGVDELLRPNEDQVRLGGLPKLSLSNDERTAAIGEAGVRGLLAKIEATQGALLEMVRTVLMRGVDRQEFSC